MKPKHNSSQDANTNSAAGKQPTKPDSTARIDATEATKARIRELDEERELRRPDPATQNEIVDAVNAVGNMFSTFVGTSVEPAFDPKARLIRIDLSVRD